MTDHSSCSTCSTALLRALFQLNVEAKRYAEAAKSAYDCGRKATARRHSLRKRALYAYKQSVLETFVETGCVDTVSRHEIDDREYYCLSVGAFSFHSPVDSWDGPPINCPPESTTVLESFDTTADSRPDHLPEHEALTRLTAPFGTPNDYLPWPFVDDGYRSTFAGWRSLPGALEVGDRVDGRFTRGRGCRDEFLFAVGDEFTTGKGRCRIHDRYEAWLPPLWDRSPIRQRPVYDVELDGEQRTSIQQQRLIDDWCILAESLHDPLPAVAGRQAEMAGDAYDESPSFDIGDVIEIDPHWNDTGPSIYRIDTVHISYNLLCCDLLPVRSGTHKTNLALSEFAEDVVAVSESPPDI